MDVYNYMQRNKQDRPQPRLKRVVDRDCNSLTADILEEMTQSDETGRGVREAIHKFTGHNGMLD